MQCFIGTYILNTDTFNVLENNVQSTIKVMDTVYCENVCFSSVSRTEGENIVQYGCWDAYSTTGIQYAGDRVCILAFSIIVQSVYMKTFS